MIKLQKKKIIIFFLCAMLVLSMIPYAIYADGDTEEDTETTETTTESSEDNEGTNETGSETDGSTQIGIVESGELFPITATKKVAENSQLELYIDEKSGNIRIVNKKSGHEWLGAPPVDKMTLPNNKKFIDSPVHVTYTDGASISQTYTLKDTTTKHSITSIENGVRVEFKMEDIKLSFAVEYTLTEDGLEVVVPDDSVKEEGMVRLTSLEVLPFFHAIERKKDGAVFVPDGSGALMKSKEVHPQYFSGYSQPVYGPDHTFKSELGEVISEGYTREFAPKELIALPVYGIYQEGAGFLAIITDGEETAYINATPSGVRNIPFYRGGVQFTYRKQDVMFIGSSGKIPFFQSKVIEGDRKLEIKLLEGEDADYVGMAKAYRAYLEEDVLLEKHSNPSAPLHIELVGGILRDEVIGSTFIDMTTFEQAKKIIDEYVKKGVKSLKITFKGWSEDGLYGNRPEHFPVESKLGGKKDLEELSSFAKELGVDLFLDVNYVRPFHESNSISARKDAVRGVDREVLESPNYHVSSRISDNQELFYLLKPERSSEVSSNELSKFLDLGISGIHFSNLGDLLYSDQDPKYLTSREETKETWVKIMDKYKESIGKVTVDYGFGYTLGHVDEIINIPLDSSQFVYFDETVPFYQIAVHGLIPYTAQPSNLRNDANVELLRAIEYGANPSFELTYNSTDKLKRTMEDNLFSSDFNYWFDRSLEEYTEFQEIYNETGDQLIEDHQQLEPKVYQTTYENGAKVIVNYNSKAVTVNGLTINGQSYVLQKGE
jgi:hypothetical protein